jgi:hypothetical protein
VPSTTTKILYRTIGQDVKVALGKIAEFAQENRAGKTQAIRKKQHVIDAGFVPDTRRRSWCIMLTEILITLNQKIYGVSVETVK